MAVFRVDHGALRPAKRLADGRLRVDATITRSGVFSYRNPDGSERLEWRPPAEVFNTDSLESFAGVPVTDEHPPVMVDVSNAKTFGVGMLMENVRKDGNHVVATMYVTDAGTIAKMNAGKRDVSCGYQCDLIEGAGVTPEGERYDAMQTNIRGNHLAIVEAGRAGSARVRMDAAINTSPEPRMLLDDALKALGAETARADKAVADLAAVELKLAAAETATATEKARADAAEKARTDAAAAVDGAVQARVALFTAAAPVLGPDVKLDAMSDRDIKAAVVAKIDGDTLDAARSDEYVGARYDGAIKRAVAATAALGELRTAVAPEIKTDANPFAKKAGEEDDDEDSARKKMEAKSATAWMKKEGK